MKKVALLTIVCFVCFTASAFAKSVNLAPGKKASCNNANSITLEVAKIANKADANNFGYTTNDRGSANVVVWKSSNATTVPISLGPNDDNRSLVGSDHGKTGLGRMGTMGKQKVVLKRQTSFSRGDSIGDISGLVTFENTGTNAVTVTCN